MKSIKNFLLDESGSAEATSSVILIAAVGLLLAAALGIYYAAITGFFSKAAGVIQGWGFGNFG